MTRVKVFAPAKVNLALHVTGQREDGYHFLDTLVGFASVGDWVTLDTDQKRGLTITGPEGAALDPAAPNLVLQTAMEFWGKGNGPLSLVLSKHLPVSSGIGGGSADAAATFRGMLWLMDRMGMPLPMDADLAKRLLQLGADVPMCVSCEPLRARGIGERREFLPAMARLPVVLVNPRVEVATKMVFKSLTKKDNSEIGRLPSDLADVGLLVSFLAKQRNDLQGPAIAAAPVIATVLKVLSETQGCTMARMSGSGATCFGIYDTAEASAVAAEKIAKDHQRWWVKAALLDGQDRAAPEQIS
mgnify:CR=1 FL=1